MANKITWADKVGLNPRKTRINQVQDRDMNEIKEMHNLDSDRIDALESGFIGSLAIADTPSQDGLYIAEESGTYTNAGGLVVDLTSTVSYISVESSQTVFNLIEVPVSQFGYNVVNNLTDFDDLITASTAGTWLILNSLTLDGNKTIPSGVSLLFRGGDIDLNSFTLTGDSTKIISGLNQIFTTTGTIAGTWDVEANPQWFGAVGDGVTDDLTAFNKVVEFKNVRVPKSTYLISDAIVIEDNVTFTGEQGVVFTGITSVDDPYFDLDSITENVILQDFKIDASSRPNSVNPTGMIKNHSTNNINGLKIINIEIETGGTFNSGIDFKSTTGIVTDIHIKNCSITCTGSEVYGVRLEKETNRAIYKDNYVSLTSASSYNAITVYEDGTDFLIEGNTVNQSGHSGIAISPASKGSIIGNKVSGVTNTSEAGIEVEWKNQHGDLISSEVVVTGNVVDDCYFGIFVTKRDQVIADDVLNLSINSNVITNTTIAGIKLVNLTRANISSNVINLASNVGVAVTDCSYLSLNNNTIDCVASGFSFSTTGSEQISIQNNNINISGAANGIESTVDIVGFNISNNILNFESGAGSSSAFKIDIGSHGIVTNNVVKGTVLRGINLGTVTDCDFIGNYFEDATNFIGATGDPESVKYLHNTGTPDSTQTVSVEGGNIQTTILKLINDKNEDQGAAMTADVDFHLWDNNTRLSTPQARIGVFGSSTASQDAEAKGRLGFYLNTGTYASPVLELVMSITDGGILNMATIPKYADDTAAASLNAGDVYQTATGELRIKL